MTPIFPNLPVDLGVYTLTQLLGSHETCDRYLARQSHVDRSVVIEVLRPGCSEEALDDFLRSVRIRVAARAPHVGLVLESMVSGNIWYLTSECPEGVPLSRYLAEGRHLGTMQACTVIRQAGILYDHCIRKGIAAEPLTPDCIFVNDDGGVTFLSPLVAGEPSAELTARQLDGLAETLRDVSPEGEAGQTRVATLLDWLVQEFDGQRMEWQAVAATAEYIMESVAPKVSSDKSKKRGGETSYARKRRSIQRRRFLLKHLPIALVCLLCAGLISFAGVPIAKFIPIKSLPPVQDDCVYLRSNGCNMAIMRNPVSIRDYKKFLDAFSSMSEKKVKVLHDGMPESVTDHTPDDWNEQLRAAKASQKWRGRAINLDSPVCGVSFYDAMAYANYRNATLPSIQLLLALREITADERVHEWTDTVFQGNAVYDKSVVVLLAEDGRTPRLESDLTNKENYTTFRLVIPILNQQKP